MYGFWDMEGDWQNVSSFWADFCPLDPENQIFKKMKKTPWQIIRLHMLTTNDNHMRYDSWDMECSRQKCFVVWTGFCPFTQLTTQKIKVLKKWKKKNVEILSYDVWFLRYGAWWTKFFVILDICCPFTPLWSKKIKILKKWKK